MRLPAVCLVLVALAVPAAGQTSSERGASVLIFPKVVSDASADTLVQIANLSESRVEVFCTYVDGAGDWQASGFGLTLLAEQPLHWPASRGRVGDGVPPAPADFRGELLCVEVDPSGAPAGGNRLVGHAAVVDLAGGDVAAAPAVGLHGLGLYDGDDVLCIGAPADVCLFGTEYDACPAAWTLAHPAAGAADRQLGAGSRLDTRVTIVPCSQNVRDGEPGSVVVQMQVTNELAQRFSTSASVSCWADLSLAEVSPVFDVATLGGEAVSTRFAPSPGSGGFALRAEVERRADAAGPVVSRSALAPQQEGAVASPDTIVLPMGRP